MAKNNNNKLKPVSTHTQEQKYIWIARLLIIFVAISLISNFIIFFAFLGISPNTKIQPVYITLQDMEEKEIQITKEISSFDGEIKSDEVKDFLISHGTISKKIATQMIKNYIIQRETSKLNREYIDAIWGSNSEIKHISSQKVYNQFINSKLVKDTKKKNTKNTTIVEILKGPTLYKLSDKNGEKLLPLLDKDQLTNSRKQQIKKNLNPLLNTEKDISDEWETTIKIKTLAPNGNIIKTEEKKVTIKAYFDWKYQIRTEKDKFKNPLGLKIVYYEYKNL